MSDWIVGFALGVGRYAEELGLYVFGSTLAALAAIALALAIGYGWTGARRLTAWARRPKR